MQAAILQTNMTTRKITHMRRKLLVRRNPENAITGYIEILTKHGQPVPKDSRVRAEQTGIDVSAAT
jgi:hypothetical protein